MKIQSTNLIRRGPAGFTLVELLTVIAIIAILAAMLLPVLAAAKNHALKVKATLQENDIVTAITKYDSDYGRFPASPAAQRQANLNGSHANGNGDFTYGGTFYDQGTAGYSAIGTVLAGPNSIQTNTDVMAILMNLTNYPGSSVLTVNTNNDLNPRMISYLNAKMVDTNADWNGVGQDLVYRDPWGNPYVITMDLNYDGECQDSFYCQARISQKPFGGSSQAGYNGLNNPNANPSGATLNDFEYHGKVMVWSAGLPLGGKAAIDSTQSAVSGANKNHIVSWQ